MGEGPWTRTPSRWNHDYFEAMFVEAWKPTRSESGSDQWWTADRNSTYADTMRLTADLALVEDDIYKEIAIAYRNDLEKDASICTQFEFGSTNIGADGGSIISGAHGS